MAVSHVYSNTNADATGTLTIWNGATTSTVAATNLVRPSDWNSAHNQLYTLTGNTNTGGVSTVSGTNIIFGGSNGISLSGTSNSIFFHDAPNHSHFYNAGVGVRASGNQGNATIHFQKIWISHPVQHDRIMFEIRFTNATNSTGSATLSQRVGIYTKNGSTLSLLSSTSTSSAWTFSGSVGSYSLQAGVRGLTIPWTNTLSVGEYYVGIWSSTASGGANMSFSQMLMSNDSQIWQGIFGSASNASVQFFPGFGHYSSTTASLPSSVPISSIQGNATIAYRVPVFHLISQTV